MMSLPESPLDPLERWRTEDLLEVLSSLGAPAVREVSAQVEDGAAYLEVQRKHLRLELLRRGVSWRRVSRAEELPAVQPR